MIKLEKNKKALVLVAHPDDETIWMGGTILKNKNLSWTIFSLCRASDSERAPKFKKVCRYYSARAIITDLDDEDRLSIKQTIPIIKDLVLKNIAQENFDYIFTHGAQGEYGHPRHIGVHLAVKELFAKNKISPRVIFYFNYRRKDYHKDFSTLIPRKNSNFVVKLSKEQFEQKKKIMANIYGFAPDGIDTNYCTNPEAFFYCHPDRISALAKRVEGSLIQCKSLYIKTISNFKTNNYYLILTS